MISLKQIDDDAWYDDGETASFLGYKSAAVVQKKRSKGTFTLPFRRFARRPHTKGSVILQAVAEGVVTPEAKAK